MYIIKFKPHPLEDWHFLKNKAETELKTYNKIQEAEEEIEILSKMVTIHNKLFSLISENTAIIAPEFKIEEASSANNIINLKQHNKEGA